MSEKISLDSSVLPYKFMFFAKVQQFSELVYITIIQLAYITIIIF